MRSLVCLVPASGTFLTINSGDRLLGLICLMMFVAGAALACQEMVRWWKARMEQLQSPPLAGLITYQLGADKRWRPTKVLWFSLHGTAPDRFQSSVHADRPAEDSVQENRAA